MVSLSLSLSDRQCARDDSRFNIDFSSTSMGLTSQEDAWGCYSAFEGRYESCRTSGNSWVGLRTFFSFRETSPYPLPSERQNPLTQAVCLSTRQRPSHTKT